MSFAPEITDGVQSAASPDNLGGFDFPVAEVWGDCAVVTSGALELLAMVLVTGGESDFLRMVRFSLGDATFTDEVVAFARDANPD